MTKSFKKYALGNRVQVGGARKISFPTTALAGIAPIKGIVARKWRIAPYKSFNGA